MKNITPLQAFNAVSMLFDIYYWETLSDDSVVWQNWLKAIRFVVSSKDSRNYLVLFKK